MHYVLCFVLLDRCTYSARMHSCCFWSRLWWADLNTVLVSTVWNLFTLQSGKTNGAQRMLDHIVCRHLLQVALCCGPSWTCSCARFADHLFMRDQATATESNKDVFVIGGHSMYVQGPTLTTISTILVVRIFVMFGASMFRTFIL